LCGRADLPTVVNLDRNDSYLRAMRDVEDRLGE